MCMCTLICTWLPGSLEISFCCSGEIFRRDGITNSNPVGTTWTQILDPICKCKHVSYDLGLLWIVSNDGTIVKCRV
ncbi:fish-egg lectin-like precursor [Alligator mississippiensis]|uniref:Fish-egg lectin-like n=1 Tax=Alligator mississippiensis TaxID=8496 RepID=A0A151M436_ALLMI|nr:fish-egg lectin-like precursor [Alligator mississippiensis]